MLSGMPELGTFYPLLHVLEVLRDSPKFSLNVGKAAEVWIEHLMLSATLPPPPNHCPFHQGKILSFSLFIHCMDGIQ